MTTDLVPVDGAAAVDVVDSHMDGWEIFGCAPDHGHRPQPPTVRRLGGAEDWPSGEITNGIAAIQVHCYGDDPDGAFVQVAGRDRARVQATYDAVVRSIETGLTTGWFDA